MGYKQEIGKTLAEQVALMVQMDEANATLKYPHEMSSAELQSMHANIQKGVANHDSLMAHHLLNIQRLMAHHKAGTGPFKS